MSEAITLGILNPPAAGSVYYEPVPVSDTDLALMQRLDELHLEFPFDDRTPDQAYFDPRPLRTAA
jgi:hypothetical protein